MQPNLMKVKAGRNDPCPCGSGRKYKRCCGEDGAARGMQVSGTQQVRTPEPTPAELNRLIAMAQAGHHAELEIRSRELVARMPNSGMLWRLLGMALWMQGKDAVHPLQKAAELFPDDAEAHANLGAALLAGGRSSEAAHCFRRALAIEPNFAVAHNNLGSALRGLGELGQAEASYRRALEFEPAIAMAHCNLGHVLLAQGLVPAAAECYQRAVETQPDFIEALNGLANTSKESGRLDQAITLYRKALSYKPENAEVLNNLACSLYDLMRLDEAEACFRQALDIDPLYAEAHNNLAKVHRLRGRVDEAEAGSLRALEIDPKLVFAYSLQSHLKSDRGEFAEAERLLKRAVELEPHSVDAWAGIPRLRKMTKDDADWLATAERMTLLPLPPRQESNLHYSIGKYHDDVGDFERAFARYRHANEVSSRYSGGHDRQSVTREFDRIIEFFDRRWLDAAPRDANPSQRPVFVVGMPRSGTTLAEQILAAHPAVFGAGEQPFWTSLLPPYVNSPPAPDIAQRILVKLGNDYLRSMEDQSMDALRVVDKMPANYKCLALLFATLPNARIIHMSRSPLDTCLSIYFQDFAVTHTYANDLGDLAHLYRHYLRLMEHWRRTLPEEWILDVPYQQLTEDPEGWSRKMIDFVGLPWDSKCLNFEQSARSILTFSKWQARQKITKSSVARWRKYEKFIGPLMPLAELDPYP
jgi:tetratricopeptide (TPR) repeat protein